MTSQEIDNAKYNWISDQLNHIRAKPKALQTMEDIQWSGWAENRLTELTPTKLHGKK